MNPTTLHPFHLLCLRDHLHHVHHAAPRRTMRPRDRSTRKMVTERTHIASRHSVGRREFPHTSEPPARRCAAALRPAPNDVKNSTTLCRERLDFRAGTTAAFWSLQTLCWSQAVWRCTGAEQHGTRDMMLASIKLE